MRDGKKLVTTVKEEFKTVIPKGKSRIQGEESLWNNGFEFFEFFL